MEDFAESVRRRVREARSAQRAATEDGDPYAAHAHADDLEGLLRLAAEHGIAVDPAGES